MPVILRKAKGFPESVYCAGTGIFFCKYEKLPFKLKMTDKKYKETIMLTCFNELIIKNRKSHLEDDNKIKVPLYLYLKP